VSLILRRRPDDAPATATVLRSAHSRVGCRAWW